MNFFIAQYRQVGNMAYVQDDYRYAEADVKSRRSL